jgi:pimeloyl-ACP methyl ester carboxylesterase
MNIYCIGDGSPTVVFDAGLANWSQIWGFVQPEIAKRTRACAFDRAGLGFSDASERANDSTNIVDDLHRLLTAADIKPPYVFVGHSYGGMNVRLYADLYRGDVAGLVLDDPSHEDFRPRFLDLAVKLNPTGPTREEYVRRQKAEDAEGRKDDQACLDAATKGVVQGTKIYEKCVSTGQNLIYTPQINAVYPRLQQTPGFLKAKMSEEDAFDEASAQELRTARRSYGDMPLVVLTALRDCPTSDETSLCVIETRVHKALHEELAQLSTRGVERVVPKSGHDIHLDQPAAVIQAINDVLDMTQVPAKK